MTKPRTTRDDETRDKELLEEWAFELASPFDLPPGVWQEGFAFHWARRDVQGTSDYRIEDLIRKGWKLVPASRAENIYIYPFSQNNYSKDFINRKDTILMERPSIYTKRERDAEHKLIRDRTRALPGMEHDTTTFSTRNSISSF